MYLSTIALLMVLALSWSAAHSWAAERLYKMTGYITAIDRACNTVVIEVPTAGKTGTQETRGHYTIKRGDGLSSIAARGEVYGDPLKWPFLYRYNMGKIGELQLVENFLDRALPEGVRLRIITPDEERENLRRRADHIFTVNVLSARTQKGLISSAIRLMREGYMVYITSAMVRDRQWMRLRVGFFKTKLEADRERKKINAILNIRNSWVTKVGKEELEEFGCY